VFEKIKNSVETPRRGVSTVKARRWSYWPQLV